MSFARKTRPTNSWTILSTLGLKIVALLFCVLLVGFVGAVGLNRANGMKTGVSPEPPPDPQDVDYSRFRHDNAAHTRLPCLICHRRDDNSARVGFPGKGGHLPCAGCHTVQFSGNTSPMCTICHTDTGLKSFPDLRSFNIKFDHSRHKGVGCATCHKTAGRGGVSQSIPSGQSAHVTCFQCHTYRSAGSMSSCDTCHQPGRLIRTPEWSVAYRKSFSHKEHLSGNSMNCSACHSVRAGAVRSKQMSSPLVTMHFAPERSVSCGGCHNGKRAFGPDDFANCKRCHGTKSFKF